MDMLQALKGAFELAQDGDFQRILQFLVDHVDATYLSNPKMKVAAKSSSSVIDREVSYMWNKPDEYSDYHRILDDHQITFTPGVPVDDVRFDIVDVRGLETGIVEVRFHLTSGETVEKQTRFEIGEMNRQLALPFRFTAPSPAERVDVLLDGQLEDTKRRSTGSEDWELIEHACPSLSVPTGRPVDDNPPIFLISVDSLRHDHLSKLSGVIDTLGEDAVIPSEPRTQGVHTMQSHASMLTSLHPSDNGCATHFQMPSDIITLPELLERNGYTSSAVAAGGGLVPDIGYGRGFHRYQRKEMSWQDRKFDAKTNTNTVIDWVETDLKHGNTAGFYFLHLFDAHFPYLPPLPVTDHDELKYRRLEQFIEKQSEYQYPELIEDDPLELDDDLLEHITTYYRESVQYIDTQLARLLGHLKSLGVFDDSFVLIVVDHGEEFNERNTTFHFSLHDAVIRPGMIVKPPADTAMTVPDTPDYIDFLPTIASLLGTEIPDQCEGQAWDDSYQLRPRISEWFHGGHYCSVSVEQDGYKGIFTYAADPPSRPTEEALESGPRLVEYAELETLRGSPDAESEIPVAMQDSLEQTAVEFIRSRRQSTESGSTELPEEVQDRLKDLGYR